MDQLKKFDAYPRTIDDFTIRTSTGAIISVVCIILMTWLFFAEYKIYRSTEVNPELVIDTTRGEKLQINFNIVFHKMACSFLSIDTMDIAGQHQLDVDHNINKTRLDADGNVKHASEKQGKLGRDEVVVNLKEGEQQQQQCGSCFGSETTPGQCCNTCEEVRESYRKKGWAFTDPSSIEQCVKEGFLDQLKEQKEEGCRMEGYIMVNKVSGNFHFSPGRSFQQNHMHIHDLEIYKLGKSFNFSHTINSLSFGTFYKKNPLDKSSKQWIKPESAMYQYFIKVVPSTFEGSSRNTVHNFYQFSVTEYERGVPEDLSQGVPGIYFMYDLSPIRIIYRVSSKSFSSFLTSVCAIIGGIFTVAGIIDSLIYQSLRGIEAKIELGKNE